jgi:hypothetical protein
VNNKRVYIGLTQDFETRIATHFKELKADEKKTTKRIQGSCGARRTAWQEDYNQYGADAFKVYKLEEDVPPETAYDREKHWIDYYNSSDPKYGYNMQCGCKASSKIVITPGIPERVNP